MASKELALAASEPVQPLIYFPHAQYPRSDMYLVVRTPTLSAGLIDALHREVSRLAPEQPLGSIIPLEQVLTESVWSRRTMAYLMSGFGVLALILALAGVYSLLAYGVARRAGELGVRLALGARPGDLLRGVLWDGLKTTLLGVALGALAAAFTSRFTASMLYDVSPLDPATFLGVGLLIVVAAVPACYWPARRAAKVDPQLALRPE
jgi:putative ABC transport system permease protein